MWYLIILFFGCSDGGRAIQTVEFNSQSACTVAGNQVLALGIKACYCEPSVKATCVYRGN
jgi:hypothetical protein